MLHVHINRTLLFYYSVLHSDSDVERNDNSAGKRIIVGPDSDIEVQTDTEAESDSDNQSDLRNETDVVNDEGNGISESDNSDLSDYDSDVDVSVYHAGYCVEKADPLAYDLDDLLRRGLIQKDGILYKFLSDITKNRVKATHQYDPMVIEFFNTIKYLGGSRTMNFIRGPMNIGQQKRGSLQDPHLAKMNLGGPSDKTLLKSQAGYTVESGPIQELNLTYLKLTESASTQLFYETDRVVIYAVALTTDGNRLKPCIEFDSRSKQGIGLKEKVILKFLEETVVTPKYLNDNIITEVVVSSLTTMDNCTSLPVATHYVTKKQKMGADVKKLLYSLTKAVQILTSEKDLP